MTAPAKPPVVGGDVVGDYRKSLAKSYIGRWDLQNPDGTYRPAIVEIASVRKYVPPDFILKKKLKQAEKTGKPMKPEFVIHFVGYRKGWILRNQGLQSVATACGDPDVGKWIGKKIVLRFDPTIKFGKDEVGGLRAHALGGGKQAAELRPPADNEPDPEVVEMLERIHAEETETIGEEAPK